MLVYKNLLEKNIYLIRNDEKSYKFHSNFFTLGYPEFILNSAKLDEFYGDIKIKSNEYILNVVRLGKFSFLKQVSKLDEPIDKTM